MHLGAPPYGPSKGRKCYNYNYRGKGARILLLGHIFHRSCAEPLAAPLTGPFFFPRQSCLLPLAAPTVAVGVPVGTAFSLPFVSIIVFHAETPHSYRLTLYIVALYHALATSYHLLHCCRVAFLSHQIAVIGSPMLEFPVVFLPPIWYGEPVPLLAAWRGLLQEETLGAPAAPLLLGGSQLHRAPSTHDSPFGGPVPIPSVRWELGFPRVCLSIEQSCSWTCSQSASYPVFFSTTCWGFLI